MTENRYENAVIALNRLKGCKLEFFYVYDILKLIELSSKSEFALTDNDILDIEKLSNQVFQERCNRMGRDL